MVQTEWKKKTSESVGSKLMNDKSREPIPAKEIPPHCPFLKQACIEQRCVFWVNLSGTQSSPVAGGEKRVTDSLCTFHALLKIGVLMLNKPASPAPAKSRLFGGS